MAEEAQEPTGERFKFGDVVVALGLLSLEQVRKAADKLASLDEHKSLGELLIEDELLTPEEVRLVLSEQGVEIMVCSDDRCGLRFNIKDYDPGKLYRCKECGARLGFPGLLDSVMRVDRFAGDSAATWPVPDELGGSPPQ